MSPEQKKLIENAIRRDEKLLVRWLTKRLADPDAAKDVAQSVYLRVWAYAEKTNIDNPRALIFKTASNLALNEMKRRNRFYRRHISPGEFSEDDPLHNIQSLEPSPEKNVSLREDLALTMAAIKALPERPRRAFMLSRFDGLSYKEIATLLKVSESSIEKYMIEALKRLRKSLIPDQEQGSTVIPFQPSPSRQKKGKLVQ